MSGRMVPSILIVVIVLTIVVIQHIEKLLNCLRIGAIPPTLL